MGKFPDYNPDQAYLLPPSVRDVLGPGHLCFFLRRGGGKLNFRSFRGEDGGEGGAAHAPEMLGLVLLFAYPLKVTSFRRFGERIREEFGFSDFAGGAPPGHLAL